MSENLKFFEKFMFFIGLGTGFGGGGGVFAGRATEGGGGRGLGIFGIVQFEKIEEGLDCDGDRFVERGRE